MIERAFLYGDLLFESMRVMNGKLLHAPRHHARLLEGAKILKYEVPDGLTLDRMAYEVESAAASEGFVNARIRFILHRDSTGFYTPDHNKARWLIQVSEMTPPRGPVADLGVFEMYRKPCNALSNIKSGNSLVYVMAGIFARENGFGDCLILNERGNIAEGVSANVFVRRGNRLMTPAASEGCIMGVMRGLVLDLATRARIHIAEGEVTMAGLSMADEIFLTNVSQGIVPVAGYCGRSLELTYASQLKETLQAEEQLML
jgi:branched-chain amino acid aminotransferase